MNKPSAAPARTAAAHVLLAVERGTAHADDQLRSPRVEALSQQDRDLATELVMGTLRWQIVLDREIAARLSRPDLDMHFLTIIALRLGAYQLLFLDRIPSHAAVNDSVELAKQADGPQAANLVNAILRRLHRERETLAGLRSQPTAAYPNWLLTRWRTRFGGTATESLCAFGQQVPPAFLRLLAPLAEESAALVPGTFLSNVRRVVSGNPVTFPDSRVQDEASQLVGEIAALNAGDSILDACAAPGGKTAVLAERNPSATITAMDVSEARLRIMQRRLSWSEPRRSPGNVLPDTGEGAKGDTRERVLFVAADASMLPSEPRYSTILCDVPCSGTGTLARNPEIRVRLLENALGRQAERQRAILNAAVRALRPGGRLLYSTCSLEPEENEQVVEAVLSSQARATLRPIEPALDELLAAGILTPEGHARLRETALAGPYLRTVPGVHPCDGFFAALLTAS